MNIRIRSKAFVAVVLSSTLMLTACDEAITMAPGSIDKTDNCSRFQQALVDARKQENQLRLQNIAGGAIAGAILGAMVSSPEDREKGAILGAVLGGAVAGTATAQDQRRKREADAKILREINTKAGTATRLYTKAGASAASLRNCRLNQLNALERSVRRKTVSVSTARSQLAVLKRRAATDNRIISATFNGIGNRVEDFVNSGAKTGGVERSIVTRQESRH